MKFHRSSGEYRERLIRASLRRVSSPLLKGTNLIVPRFESPVRNRRLGSLNRILTAFQEFTRGLFRRKRDIPLVVGEERRRNWRLDVVHENIRARSSLFVGRIKGEIFGEKEFEGRAVRIEKSGRQTRVVLRNLTSGGALFVSGHKAATSIPWNARLCMRRLLPRMRRYGTGNVCSRLIEFPAPAKVWRSVWHGIHQFASFDLA